MFKDSRARDPPVLGDVADEQGRKVGFLGDTDQGGGDGAHLGDAPRPALHLSRGDRLHRVDDQQGGGRLLNVAEDDSQLRLVRDQEVWLQSPDALRASAHLRRRLLSRDVQDRPEAARSGGARGLGRDVQQQRGLAHSGLPGQQDHGPRDDAPAEHAVELAHARRTQGRALPVDLADGQGGASGSRRGRPGAA